MLPATGAACQRSRLASARRAEAPSGAGRRMATLAATESQRGTVPVTRLWKPTPARPAGQRHARPVDPKRIARAPKESHADGHHQSHQRPPRRGPQPPGQSLRRRAVRGRDPSRRGHCSLPTARSSCGPASTPAARRRTSSSSMSRRATTRSGGGRSTGPSARRTTIACGRASSPTAPSATCTRRTA